MAIRKNGPGIRCVNCGCRLDSGERCDCEQQEAQRKAVQAAAKTRRRAQPGDEGTMYRSPEACDAKRGRTNAIIAHNLRMMEQAQAEWDYA